jgi:agmatine/peptidylarginine deiminase
LVILYGISEKDEHDIQTLKKELEELQQQHKDNFKLIHLPITFRENSDSKLTGTHRKLVIKDNDFYIAGSFNFLSFGKNEKQQVANEESIANYKGRAEKMGASF